MTEEEQSKVPTGAWKQWNDTKYSDADQPFIYELRANDYYDKLKLNGSSGWHKYERDDIPTGCEDCCWDSIHRELNTNFNTHGLSELDRQQQ